jgi:hypothetical protein
MEKVKQEIIEMCEKEIARGTIFVAYYKQLEMKQKKEDAAKTKMKRMQIEDTIVTNSDMLKFFKSYK